MKTFLAPALSVIARLSLGGNFALAIVLFLLPLLVVLILPDGPIFQRDAAKNGSVVMASLLQDQKARMGVLVLSELFAIYFLLGVYFWTKTGLVQLSDAMERISSGDLSARIDPDAALVSQHSEAGRLWRSAQQLSQNLLELVKQVRASAGAIAVTAGKISAGNTGKTTQEVLDINGETVRLMGMVEIFKFDRMEDRDRAVALVKKAVAHILRVGAQVAFKDFNSPNGEFKYGEFYIFVLDLIGTRLAHGFDPSLCGQSVYHLKDASGKRFTRETINIAKAKGKGWCDYKFLNPATKKVEQKSTYVELVGTLIVGCGIYNRESGASQSL